MLSTIFTTEEGDLFEELSKGASSSNIV